MNFLTFCEQGFFFFHQKIRPSGMTENNELRTSTVFMIHSLTQSKTDDEDLNTLTNFYRFLSILLKCNIFLGRSFLVQHIYSFLLTHTLSLCFLYDGERIQTIELK